MQFHYDGFTPGDPAVADQSRRVTTGGTQGSLPQEVDVLIVGCGPAGLTLAAQLSGFPDIRTCIIEQKPGPLLRGQADGIACRTMEMFEAFGFSERVLKESYWVNETTFWKPDPDNLETIARSGRVQDTEDGLSEFPHVILSQARIHDFYLEHMRNSKSAIEPYYSRKLVDLIVSQTLDDPFTIARIERVDTDGTAQIETVKARYVIGCDGARSTVRKSIGLSLMGDSANHAWGVMDLLAVTDFPDVRFKSLIQSHASGSMIIIPREGGYLFRLYIEMGKLGEQERAADRNMTADDLILAAQKIFAPYTLDVKEVAWWSVYEIGQRLSERFDNADVDRPDREPNVFIAGDACHTHSPKAGQGMNVSMQDAFNLGWKIAAVLRGQTSPALLSSYSTERQAIASELINFDREWAQVLSSSSNKADAEQTQRYFVQHGRYTAGTATRYAASYLTASVTHQHLAKGLIAGTRFHSATVTRAADAKPVQLGHTMKADGRWRLFAFAGNSLSGAEDAAIISLCQFLQHDPGSPLRRYTPQSHDVDSVLDVRAIYQGNASNVPLAHLPNVLRPCKGRYDLIDYEKVFFSHSPGCPDIFDAREINRAQGCLIIIRPDQFIAEVLPLNAHQQLSAFFDRFMLEPSSLRA